MVAKESAVSILIFIHLKLQACTCQLERAAFRHKVYDFVNNLFRLVLRSICLVAYYEISCAILRSCTTETFLHPTILDIIAC